MEYTRIGLASWIALEIGLSLVGGAIVGSRQSAGLIRYGTAIGSAIGLFYSSVADGPVSEFTSRHALGIAFGGCWGVAWGWQFGEQAHQERDLRSVTHS